jgi:hypothetical protein
MVLAHVERQGGPPILRTQMQWSQNAWQGGYSSSFWLLLIHSQSDNLTKTQEFET